jgi:A/G-specific adenine glycosylase
MPPQPADATDPLSTARVRAIRRALLAWGDEHGQDFPWRDARNPYWALVAAVASQQTQMSRVLPTWERWIAAFPTLADAAAADRASVLRVWAGAGYPRRALALRETAAICTAQHGGALPREPEALLALPGVGPFTAAIVRCFGWGDDGAAIDTNVVRVLGRLVHGDVQPALETSPTTIRASAERLLPPGEAGRWNAALMDYGAQVCTPRPRCEPCAVARLCAARPRFEAGAQATPVRAQGAFNGSDRQWRGRILRALRQSDGPVVTAKLIRGLASDAEEAARARRLLRALCAEGLAWQRGARCGLGDPPVAGDKPPR